MKSRRFLSALLCAVLALTLLTPAALANSWGLKSGDNTKRCIQNP